MKNIFFAAIFFFHFISQNVFANYVLITGANQGIGMGFVQHYLEKGFVVYATYRSEEQSKDFLSIKNQKLVPIKVNFENIESSIKSIKEAIQDKPLDILVLNAGYFAHKANTFGTLEAHDFQQSFTVNTIVPILLTQALLENLKSGKDKKIIAISSRRGSIQNSKDDQYTGRYAYRSSKAALNAAMSALSLDLPNMTVLILHPGRVATALTNYDPNGITVKASIAGMVKLIDSSSINDSGKFYDYLGKPIAW